MSDVPVNSKMMFPAELTSLSPLAEWLAQQMAPLPVADEWRFALDLAACETATNIIRYALHEDRESRGDEHFDVDPLAESGRGLRLILCAVDFFDVEMNAGKNITTLIKALPDPAVNYSTDKNDG